MLRKLSDLLATKPDASIGRDAVSLVGGTRVHDCAETLPVVVVDVDSLVSVRYHEAFFLVAVEDDLQAPAVSAAIFGSDTPNAGFQKVRPARAAVRERELDLAMLVAEPHGIEQFLACGTVRETEVALGDVNDGGHPTNLLIERPWNGARVSPLSTSGEPPVHPNRNYTNYNITPIYGQYINTFEPLPLPL
jgi:hypothetical protein